MDFCLTRRYPDVSETGRKQRYFYTHLCQGNPPLDAPDKTVDLGIVFLSVRGASKRLDERT